ncbi:MAG: hypothetical protein WBZ36_13535 [Candidatus Nitrosopolaris sp.]
MIEKEAEANYGYDLANRPTEEELSRIFNVLMVALKRLLNQNRIYINEKTIKQRRER